jgi:excisionase family DNA binding protein
MFTKNIRIGILQTWIRRINKTIPRRIWNNGVYVHKIVRSITATIYLKYQSYENSVYRRIIRTSGINKGEHPWEIESILKGLNQKTIPERLSLVEAAQYLGVSKSYMYKLTHTRAIPFNKFGKRVIFYTKELDEWIKQNAIRVKTGKK